MTGHEFEVDLRSAEKRVTASAAADASAGTAGPSSADRRGSTAPPKSAVAVAPEANGAVRGSVRPASPGGPGGPPSEGPRPVADAATAAGRGSTPDDEYQTLADGHLRFLSAYSPGSWHPLTVGSLTWVIRDVLAATTLEDARWAARGGQAILEALDLVAERRRTDVSSSDGVDSRAGGS